MQPTQVESGHVFDRGPARFDEPPFGRDVARLEQNVAHWAMTQSSETVASYSQGTTHRRARRALEHGDLTMCRQLVMELSDRGARADLHRHLGRLVRDDSPRCAHLTRVGARCSADGPSGGAAAHADRAGIDPTDLFGERLERRTQSHTPSGIVSRCCTSPQLAPVGSTLPGFMTLSGSNARRARF